MLKLALCEVASAVRSQSKELRMIRNLARRGNQLVQGREGGAWPRQVCPLWNARTQVKGLPWGYREQTWN